MPCRRDACSGAHSSIRVPAPARNPTRSPASFTEIQLNQLSSLSGCQTIQILPNNTAIQSFFDSHEIATNHSWTTFLPNIFFPWLHLWDLTYFKFIFTSLTGQLYYIRVYSIKSTTSLCIITSHTLFSTQNWSWRNLYQVVYCMVIVLLKFFMDLQIDLKMYELLNVLYITIFTLRVI